MGQPYKWLSNPPKEHKSFAKMYAGFVSTSTSIIATSPLDVLKTQIQVSGSRVEYRHLLVSILQKQSFTGLYRGLLTNLSTRPVFYGIFQPIYGTLKGVHFVGDPNSDSKVTRYSNRVCQSLLAGWSGIIATNPLWVLKTRMQTQILNQRGAISKVVSPKKLTYSRLVKDIATREGLRGFYKGTGVSLIKGFDIGIVFPLREFLQEEYQLPAAVAGGIAKFTGNLVLYPLDVVRTYQRNITSRVNFGQSAAALLRKHHCSVPKAFYRGLGMYSIQTVTQFVLMMEIYDYLNK